MVKDIFELLVAVYLIFLNCFILRLFSLHDNWQHVPVRLVSFHAWVAPVFWDNRTLPIAN